MSEYLKFNVFDISITKKKQIFKCVPGDLDLRANRPWFYKDHFCISCKDVSKLENTEHILECKVLNNKNELITYIPTLAQLYSDNIET